MRDDASLSFSPEDLARQVRRLRQDSLAIAAPLSAEDQTVQTAPFVSPTKWHLAHTTWFWEQFVIGVLDPDAPVFDERFGYLFNSYYNALGPRHARAARGHLTRPSCAEVMAYRAHVDAALERLLPHAGTALTEIVALGIAHEQQHQELMLTDIKHVLSQNPLNCAAYPEPEAPDVGEPTHERDLALGWTRFEEGVFWFGADPDAFAFDHEGPQHRVFLRAFELAHRPVSQGEIAAFIADGGYETPSLWLSDGWDWVTAQHRCAPDYWRGGPGEWRIFTLHGEVALSAHAPACHLSYYEAAAVAAWMGARLPTEYEWEHAAASQDPSLGDFLTPGAPAPPRAPSPGHATGRPCGLFGGVWEWTSSAYGAYPGFVPTRDVLGEYNGKFMCNQFVLRGGSCATPQGHVRASYRNFFYPDNTWQFSGVRVARDA